MKRTLLAGLFVLFIVQVSFAQVYKWVDEKGATHFTDDVTQVPEKYRPVTRGVQVPQGNDETKAEEELAPNKKDNPYKDRLGRGEEYWKGLIEEWSKKLLGLQDKLVALRGKYNDLTEKHNESRSAAMRTRFRTERDQVKSEMDQCRAQIEEARLMLEKRIPEEAELYKAKSEWVKR